MKKVFQFIILLIPILINGQTSQTLTTSGTFTVPCGVTSITVQCWGGGGAGGGSSSGNTNFGGGGGGSGAYCSSALTVGSGQVFTYTIGAGGTGVVSGNGNNGSATTFTGTSVNIIAGGGNGGVANAGAGGTGGTASGATTNTNGNNGTAGGANGQVGGASPNGGSGGASTTNSTGNTGTAPGGGGGGGEKSGTTGNVAGGAGGAGRIVVTYIAQAANAGPDQTINCSGTTATLAANTITGFTGAWSTISGSGTATTPSSATSNVTGLTIGASTTLQWVLTYSTGCSLAADQVVITSSSACPPTNDEPTGATPVSVGATCSYSTFTNASATSSTCGTIPAPGCSSYTGGDVWFSVTVPASGGFILDSQTGIITDGGAAVYSGSACGVMTLIGCDDDSSPNGAMPMLTVSGQTPGTTLFIRFWEYGNDNNGTFGLCLSDLPVAPANDNCSGAYTVAVNSSSICTSQTGGTVAGATASGVALGSCFGTPDDDVWYSFVATATTHTINITNVAGSVTDMYHSVYSGSCGSLGAALVCSDPNTSTVTGLTIGNTYYIRVYTYTSTSGQTSTFSVCVTTPPPPPANDNPCTATAAAVNSAYGCTVTTGGTVLGATSSTVGIGACGGTADDDVWYTFVANNTTQNISLLNIAGSTSDMYFSVHPGTCGAIGTALVCSDPESGTVTGLTVGTTYYVRIYTWTSSSGQTSTFSLCISPPPTPPTNDNPCTATTATVNSSSSCTVQTGGTLVGATASTVGIGACGGTADDDVWYSFVANATTQNISLNNIAGSTSDLYFSVHPGTCGSIGAALLCSDPESGSVSGLTVGTTYYIRVYSYTSTSGQTSTFSLCITPPPSNDNPCGATPAPVNSTYACTVTTGGSVLGATSSTVGLGSCFGTADDDVWYSFVANNSTQNISLLNLGGSTTDMYFSVHPGTCGSIGAALLCSDPESGTVTGLTVGTTYYIRIYTYTSTSGQTSTFSLCITPPCGTPSNDNCSGATPVPVSSSLTCTSPVYGTVCGATASGIALGACFGTPDDDVWFSFVATSTAQTISLSNITGSTTDMYHSVYSGACGSLGTALVCSDPNTSTVNGLTIGNTYYIRVYTYTGTSGQTSTFSVCVTTPAPTGPCGNATNNDFCSNPASLTPAVGSFSSSTSGLYTADQPGNLSSAFCGSIENNSWYFFVATSSTAVFPITSVSNCVSSSGIQAHVYAVSQSTLGCCTSFTSVSNCFNPGTTSTGTVTATGLSAGQTYVLMVDGNGGNVCDYTIANWSVTGVLPIELMNFVGRNEDDKNKIQWVTATEKNTTLFKLEKSRDGLSFENVLDVAAANESQSPKYYTAFDLTPFEAITYYRLKLYYQNGNYDYSNIISINNANLTNYISEVRPNPTNGNIEFDVNMKGKGKIFVEIYDNMGNLINSSEQTLETGYKSLNLDLNSYDSGIYLMKVTFENSGKSEIQKIIKN